MTPAEPAGRHLRGPAGRHRARRRRSAPGRLALVLAVAAGATLAVALLGTAPPAAAPAGTSAEVPRPLAVAVGSSAGPAPAPTRVRVPSIGVSSEVVRLGVDAERVLVPPADHATAGWFAEGPAPGATGPAVLAGHVDSAEGPAVFFRLAELEPGDEVQVDRADGSTARFEVRSVDRYPKDAFPTEEVYGTTALAELRLITCGGEFDADARSYRDNVVVSAVLA